MGTQKECLEVFSNVLMLTWKIRPLVDVLGFLFRSAQELNEMTLRRSCPKGCFAGWWSGGVSGRRSDLLPSCLPWKLTITLPHGYTRYLTDTYNFPKLQKIVSMASIESACILKGTLPVATPLRLHKHWWHYCNLSQPQVHLPEELVSCMKSNLKVKTSLWASRKFGKKYAEMPQNALKCWNRISSPKELISLGNTIASCTDSVEANQVELWSENTTLHLDSLWLFFTQKIHQFETSMVCKSWRASIHKEQRSNVEITAL